MRLAVQEHLLPGTTLAEKWRFAESAGFAGIELRGDERLGGRREEVRAAVAEGAVVSSICAISTTSYIGSFDPERRREGVERMRRLIDVAGEVGARGVVTPNAYGQFSRNLPPFTPPRSDEEDRALLLEALSELGDRAQRAGTLIYLEPLNRYEDHVWNRIEQAAAFCRELGSPAVKVMGDLFHMNIEEPDPPAAIRAAEGILDHVHLADSHRYEPGSGHIDVASHAAALRDIGFTGWMALECRLTGAAEDVLPRVAARLRPLLGSGDAVGRASI